VDSHGVGEVAAIHFNTKVKPMDDIRVRQAIAYCLDRERFLTAAASKISGPVYSAVPSQFLPGGLTFDEVRLLNLDYGTDRKRSLELMSQAGYPDGFTIDLVTSEKRFYHALYKLLKEQLSAINIKCNLTVVPHSEMHKRIRINPGAIVIYAAWRPNADVYLTRFFHSNSTVVTGKKPDTNFSAFNKIDSLIEDARVEVKPEKQQTLWSQAQIIILNDMVSYPIMYTKQLYVRKSYVDYGHSLVSTMALYPQFTEKTQINSVK
jgi:peptide/nickel transport system substrate-binding protein